FARDADGRRLVSNTAQSKVFLRTEPVFDCSDIIGRVYADLNRDGYYQDGEPGIAGVRLATVNGLLVNTDRWGRYSIACPEVPDNSIGSNFILKLDERTLPQGYSVTSENPSTIRLTRGKIAKLDFGAAGARLVELDLDERSFEPGTATPTAATIRALSLLLDRLAEEPSRLRITYLGATSELSKRRLELVSSLVAGGWKARPGPYELPVEGVHRLQ
nr:hypothetical protein [Nitratireductor sp.]